jgi:S-methylmethionine-dependent homocysteine/selenocysteine methylase
MTSIAFLDGGLGQEINKRSKQKISHPLWSVKVMQEDPEIVIGVHKDFLFAGAKVISLNNYTASITRLSRHGFGDKFQETHQLAIQLINKAIAESGLARNSINIAGCLPPLAASYVSSAALDYQQSYDEFCQLIEVQSGGVDLFLVETISNITEAKAAITALKHYNKKTYIGLTLTDDLSNTLRSGETLEEAVEHFSDEKIDALLLNCSFPEAIDKAMKVLQTSGLRYGGYANGFTSIENLSPGATVDGLQARIDLGPEKYAEHVIGWLDMGATIIGGCCEIGPEHIKYLSQQLTAKGHELTTLV